MLLVNFIGTFSTNGWSNAMLHERVGTDLSTFVEYQCSHMGLPITLQQQWVAEGIALPSCAIKPLVQLANYFLLRLAMVLHVLSSRVYFPAELLTQIIRWWYQRLLLNHVHPKNMLYHWAKDLTHCSVHGDSIHFTSLTEYRTSSQTRDSNCASEFQSGL